MIRALAAVALLAALSPATAAELTREQAAIIYQIALRLSPQYQAPNVAPEIHLLKRPALKERVCRREIPRDCDTCMLQAEINGACLKAVNEAQLHGLTDWQVIYLAVDLDFADTFSASILLHEMVHYIQQWNLGRIVSCEQKFALEQEARSVQIQSLREQRGDYEHSIASLVRGLNGYRCIAPERQG
jgi:hypothetical protein